jgi:hypothetical protein
MVEWVQNENILQNELCQNAAERILHGEKVNTLCSTAEKENRLKPRTRAFQQWWRDSEVVALYNRVAGTTWILIGIVLFSIGVSIWGITHYCITNNRDKRNVGMITDFMNRFPGLAPSKRREQEEFYTSPLERRRKESLKYRY